MDAKAKDIEIDIESITRYYKIGEDILEKSKGQPSRGTIQRLAVENKIHPEIARKLRQLADKEKGGFTWRELEIQFRKFRNKSKSIKITHFIRSLMIPRGNDRDKALEVALEQGLSSHGFLAYISTMFPKKRKAGRNPKTFYTENLDILIGRMLLGWSRQLILYLERGSFSNIQLKEKVEQLKIDMDEAIKLVPVGGEEQ